MTTVAILVSIGVLLGTDGRLDLSDRVFRQLEFWGQKADSPESEMEIGRKWFGSDLDFTIRKERGQRLTSARRRLIFSPPFPMTAPAHLLLTRIRSSYFPAAMASEKLKPFGLNQSHTAVMCVKYH